MLRHLAAQVRHRMKVYETWGFSAKGRRGLGVSALFTGESGTGKTMAAEVLARELRLRSVSHRSFGGGQQIHWRDREELKQVFDAAEEGGASAALRRGGRAVRQAQRGARTATTVTPTSK